MSKYERGIRSLKASERFLLALVMEIANPRQQDLIWATIYGLRLACEAAEMVEREQAETPR